MAIIELRYYQTSVGEQPFTEFEDYKARSAKAKPRGRA